MLANVEFTPFVPTPKTLPVPPAPTVIGYVVWYARVSPVPCKSPPAPPAPYLPPPPPPATTK